MAAVESYMPDAAVEPQEVQPDPMAWIMGAPQQPNLVDYLDEETRSSLGERVIAEYELDKDTCKDWQERCDRAIEMAAMVKGEKSYPWPKASNIKYPLIIKAAIEFNAQAYPSLVPPGDIVKVAVNGKDPTGGKASRAARVGAHMSHQLRKRVYGWEEDTDRLLMMLSVAGTMHRKLWPDGAGRICQKLCRPGSVVLNDKAASLDAAPRVSERFALYPHEVIERQRAGRFVDGDWMDVSDDTKNDSLAPRWFIEQHRREDIDGDGYPEPYIVTVHELSRTVVRVVANWQPQDVIAGPEGVAAIKPARYYADYHFMPNPSGGYYSLGFGALLGDLGETINATINMLMDGGHREMLGAGFIGREARLRGGWTPLKPGEYRQIDAAGQDLRAAIVNAPGAGASPVLFNMLGMLIDAGQSLANTKDIQEMSQRSNMPATTTLALIEQGMQVYGAIFKRIHRAMSQEFAMIARFNAEGLDPQEYARFHDEPADPRADYAMEDDDIEPVADPRAVTSMQKMAQANLLREMGATGEIDRTAATMRVLDAAGIPDREELMPPPSGAQKAAEEAQVRAVMLANVEQALKIAELEAKIANIDADTMKKVVEAEVADPLSPLAVARAELDALKERIKGSDARGLGGMENAPGNETGAGQPFGVGEPSAGSGLSGIMAGGAEPGPADAGAMGFGPGMV